MRGESPGQGQSAAEEARFDLGLEHEGDSEKGGHSLCRRVSGSERQREQLAPVEVRGLEQSERLIAASVRAAIKEDHQPEAGGLIHNRFPSPSSGGWGVLDQGTCRFSVF